LAWTLKKWALSAFIATHIAILGLWNMPRCPIRQKFIDWPAPYMLATGLWQDWCMFAPDPGKASIALEAITLDNRGMARIFAFPSLMNMNAWDKTFVFRHAKFAANLGLPDSNAHREFAARHVLRSLDLPAEAFPVKVQLYYKVWPTPEPGTPPEKITLKAENSVIKTYEFPTREEALP
jgi:hypothetical protein